MVDEKIADVQSSFIMSAIVPLDDLDEDLILAGSLQNICDSENKEKTHRRNDITGNSSMALAGFGFLTIVCMGMWMYHEQHFFHDSLNHVTLHQRMQNLLFDNYGSFDQKKFGFSSASKTSANFLELAGSSLNKSNYNAGVASSFSFDTILGPEDKPIVDEDRSYALKTFPNGIRFLAVEDPHARTGAIGFAVDHGSWREPSDAPGVAHMR